MGVCPQFDTVFDTLTVKEHFIFYCRLKGVPSHMLRAEVQRIAEAVFLDGDALNMPSSTLSGGMRRRLSIGIYMSKLIA
jgi:ATP-binding cassette, subfamily A (ABC1), member 3